MAAEPDKSDERSHLMMRVTERFEHLVVGVLLALMMLAIVASTIDLAWTFLKELIAPPRFLIGVDQVMQIFGLVFTILIGLELLETVKTVLSKEQLHVEVVFLVAMIAVARKVIILEVKKPEDFTMLIGIAAVVLALALGFYFVKLAYRKGAQHIKEPTVDD